MAWYGPNAGGRTHRVAARSPNGLGLYDLSGNVWEWVWDGYQRHPPAGPDPMGEPFPSIRTMRGGDWGVDAASVRVSARYWSSPQSWFSGLGFRLARTLP